MKFQNHPFSSEAIEQINFVAISMLTTHLITILEIDRTHTKQITNPEHVTLFTHSGQRIILCAVLLLCYIVTKQHSNH